jgi:predicted RNase H-like HicB family nuclease
MSLDNYKVALYRTSRMAGLAEVPAVCGCYALIPAREEALAELGSVFEMISAECGEQGLSLPADSTVIVNT